ncbi:unnamed protein product [Calypogeia fissa]
MFYDLNLAVDGVGDQTRREMVAMAMQLGYTGVAANHTFTGIMADSDRCKIRPLELKMILSAAPAVAESARFHRQLLSIPHGQPFRQFSRITVVVESPAQANALNSGNPVLKTYDIIAVRPTNQKAFNQACTNSEVDIISLDLSQKLPFRLKMPIVKAAVERGVYFEICYGRTIFDPKARRELFANAQMLLAATRGRNIIVSSGARRALELRGPNDAANMSTFFGLKLESAKAAVSRNCKAVLMRGVMRKATHRDAIHITHTTETENAVDPDNLFNVPMDWDPLSLGGASADFIPMDNTADLALKRESPPSSLIGLAEDRIKSTSAGDGSSLFASLKATGQSVDYEKQTQIEDKSEGDSKVTASQAKGDSQMTAREAKGDAKVTVSQELDLLTGGLRFHSKARDPVEASASAKKENTLPSPVIAVRKQEIRDTKKKVEPEVEKLGSKKGKKRKRKK